MTLILLVSPATDAQNIELRVNGKCQPKNWIQRANEKFDTHAFWPAEKKQLERLKYYLQTDKKQENLDEYNQMRTGKIVKSGEELAVDLHKSMLEGPLCQAEHNWTPPPECRKNIAQIRKEFRQETEANAAKWFSLEEQTRKKPLNWRKPA